MHEIYRRLGVDNNSISKAYQALFSTEMSLDLIHKIQQASTFSMPLGSNSFKHQIEQVLKRKLGYAKRGRQIKQNK